MEARVGIEPTIEDLQSSTRPNGSVVLVDTCELLLIAVICNVSSPIVILLDCTHYAN